MNAPIARPHIPSAEFCECRAMMHAPVPNERPVIVAGLTLSAETVSATAAPIFEAIGAEATSRLCLALGGTSYETVSGPIAEVIGGTLARQLASALGPGRIPIPRNPISREAKRRKVVAFGAAGRPRQEIALELGLSERQVYQILATAKRAASG